MTTSVGGSRRRSETCENRVPLGSTDKRRACPLGAGGDARRCRLLARCSQRPSAAHAPGRRCPGFTLIELIVVMAIVALLVSIAAPRYLHSVERAREATLRASLVVMRDAIDRFAADRARYPDSLDELVATRYLRTLPEDPITGQRSGWLELAPPADSLLPGRVVDVRSGAAGRARDGALYAEW